MLSIFGQSVLTLILLNEICSAKGSNISTDFLRSVIDSHRVVISDRSALATLFELRITNLIPANVGRRCERNIQVETEYLTGSDVYYLAVSSTVSECDGSERTKAAVVKRSFVTTGCRTVYPIDQVNKTCGAATAQPESSALHLPLVFYNWSFLGITDKLRGRGVSLSEPYDVLITTASRMHVEVGDTTSVELSTFLRNRLPQMNPQMALIVFRGRLANPDEASVTTVAIVEAESGEVLVIARDVPVVLAPPLP